MVLDIHAPCGILLFQKKKKKEEEEEIKNSTFLIYISMEAL